MKDYSNKEQFVIYFRWVNKGFDTHDNIKAGTLVTFIKHVLIRINVPLLNALYQCYDSAKNMCGIKNGVSNKILSENPKVFFTHRFGHTLNFVVADIVKNVQFLKDSRDTTYEISNLIKNSLKRCNATENPKRYIVRISKIYSTLSHKMDSKG